MEMGRTPTAPPGQKRERNHPHNHAGNESVWRGVCAALAVTSAVRWREQIPPAKQPSQRADSQVADSTSTRGNELHTPPQLKQPELRPEPNTRAKRGVPTESAQTRNCAERR